MYVEDDLWNWIEERCAKANMCATVEGVKDILEYCGVWCSLDGIRYETEDLNMTLEECCKEYWYIIDDNKILFTNPDEFSEDLDEYLGL